MRGKNIYEIEMNGGEILNKNIVFVLIILNLEYNVSDELASYMLLALDTSISRLCITTCTYYNFNKILC